MSKAGKIGTPFFVLAPVFALALAALPRADVAAYAPRNCTLDPDTVPVQEQPVTVAYAGADSLGTVTSVTAPEDSGIRVDRVDGQSKAISLNTSRAAEGDWMLTLMGGEQKTCTANLTVRKAAEGR